MHKQLNVATVSAKLKETTARAAFFARENYRKLQGVAVHSTCVSEDESTLHQYDSAPVSLSEMQREACCGHLCSAAREHTFGYELPSAILSSAQLPMHILDDFEVGFIAEQAI